ncbi:MAG: TraB/GumN family protein [Bacillota bacterium]
MKRAVRAVTIVIAVIMALSLQINVFAQEQIQPVEQPSAWAVEGVQWSEIYELAHQDMYGKYTKKVNREELYAVCVNLYERITGEAITPVEKSPFSDTESVSILKACAVNILTGKGKFEPQKEATRLEMVTAAVNVIKAAHSDLDFRAAINLSYKDASRIPESSLDTVGYAVSKGILKGRSDNTLDLFASCSRQELMVFARNTYEFVIYETGRDSKGAFWKVSDEDSTVYLLGSVHVADKSMYPLSKAILNAYEESDALVVEADITNQQEGILYMQQKMMYMDDNTLEKSIPKEVYDRFVEVITPLGIPAEIYNKFKPWYAAMLVQSIQLSQNSYDANLGIDLFFLTKAAGEKEIIEIEGIKFQVDMFDSFSKELQIQYLAAALNPDTEAQEKQMEAIQNIMNSWKTGNTLEIEKLLEVEEGEYSTEEAKEFSEKMWITRNDNMTQKVKSYLADPEKKTYFVVVGAGHMVGKNGIVTQLKGEYEIEQMK